MSVCGGRSEWKYEKNHPSRHTQINGQNKICGLNKQHTKWHTINYFISAESTRYVRGGTDERHTNKFSNTGHDVIIV